MNLNTVRLEGKLENDLFYQIADFQGILVWLGGCAAIHGNNGRIEQRSLEWWPITR